MPPAISRIARGAPKDRKKGVPGRTQSHKFRAQDFVRKRQNEILEDHYTTGKMLGEGQFGEVFIGTVKQSNGGKGDNRAIKRIQKELLTEEDHEEVFNEFTTLKQMDHPNICKMYEFFEEKENFWFVQELCSGGELLDELERIETFTEAIAALIMKQVLSCVHYCHSQKQIVHRDLKLENILLEEGTTERSGAEGESYNPMIVKVIDFGLAASYTEGQVLSAPVGSMHYIAPEVLEQAYNHKADIWSCGVIAYILLCGYAPFDGGSDRDMRELIMMGNVSFEDPIWKNNISNEAKDFVTTLLTYEADKRPEAGEALKHPWIQNAHKAHAEQFKANKSGTDAAVNALQNCRSFEAASKLKQATCAFMTSQLVLSGEDEKEANDGDKMGEEGANAASSHASAMLIGEIFRAMDLDSDGRLSKEELRLGFLDFLGDSVGLSVEEVDDIFLRMDLSFTGYIDYSEFVVAAIGLHDQEQVHHQVLLKQAFLRLLDRDGSGFISHEKLRKEMAPFYGEDVEDAIIKKIIDQADEDKDGQVSWNDFQTMMARKADFQTPKDATVLEEWAKQRRGGATTTSKVPSKPVPVKEDGQATEIATVGADESLTAISKTPLTSGRKARTSTGAKSRLISAMFEKNLEKNREMGFDKFQYTSKKANNIQKRKLPRTRRINFEELSSKASTTVAFDSQAIMAGRNKELEELNSTPGRARQRRATIVNMFSQEQEESKIRKESRLKELESLKGRNGGMQRQLRHSFQNVQNSATRTNERQQRGQRSKKLENVRKSIAVTSGARKELFEMWSEHDARPSISELRPSPTILLKDFKAFQKSFGQPEGLKQRFANSQRSLPAEKNLQRGGGRSWTRRLSGKSLLKNSRHESSLHGSLHGSSRGFLRGSLHGSSHGSLRNSLHGSSHGSLRGSLHGSSHGSLRGSSHASSHGSPQDSVRGSLYGSRHHSRRKMERRASEQDMQEGQVEERLIGMQPEAKTPKSARTIGPIRRLNSFDADQEQDERDERLDHIAPEISPQAPDWKSLKLPPGSAGSRPTRSSMSSHDTTAKKHGRLQEMQQDGESAKPKPSPLSPYQARRSKERDELNSSKHKISDKTQNTGQPESAGQSNDALNGSLVQGNSITDTAKTTDANANTDTDASTDDLSTAPVIEEPGEATPPPPKKSPRRGPSHEKAVGTASPSNGAEKAGPRDPKKTFIAPRNAPRLGTPTTTPNSTKQRRRIATRPKSKTSPGASPGVSEAQARFQEMARDREKKSQSSKDEVEAPSSPKAVDEAEATTISGDNPESQ